MRTIKQRIYQFDELSQEAKEKAREWYRRNDPYRNEYIDGECRASLQAFEEYFPIHVTGWVISPWGRSYVRFHMTCDPEIAELKGVRLWKYLKANYPISSKDCPFTGVCYDEDLLDPVRKFMDRPDLHTDFQELMRDCLDSWKNASIGELEYRDTNEYIDEEIRGNKYEFFEDGTRYHASRGGVLS